MRFSAMERPGQQMPRLVLGTTLKVRNFESMVFIDKIGETGLQGMMCYVRRVCEEEAKPCRGPLQRLWTWPKA